MAQMIQRYLPIDDLDIQRVDRAGRTVTAYAASFGEETEIRDQHGHYFESIHRGAFNRTLSHGFGRVQVFYNHGRDLSGRPNLLGAVPIATPVDIRPDGKGLLTIARYNDGEVADAILAAWAGGQIRGQSFSGPVYNSKPRGKRDGIPSIERMELGLKEFGPTHSPAYEGAGLVAIRSQEDLAELIRSMISDITGTPLAPPVDRGTSVPDLATLGDSPEHDSGHSSRVMRARQLALRARRLTTTGVRSHATSPEFGHDPAGHHPG